MKFLVINGPNINMLGIREPDIYGKQSYKDLIKFIKECAKNRGIKAKLFQSNSEAAIVTAIQKAYNKIDGIIINPAAYTHTSVAILDALKAVAIPAVEVHISKVPEREAFRQVSYAGMFCFKTITGLGFKGYEEAMDALIEKLK
ncbi:MAG: type II 3-dehydroquinate dehydratase [Spirochaetaceae bacterium]|nr:type II 3-dehydroquinate dehydratase [Spirochaetaceae bacterium]